MKKKKKTYSIKVGRFVGSLQKHKNGASWYCSYTYVDASGKRIQMQKSLNCPIATTSESQAMEIMTEFLLNLKAKTAVKVDIKSTVVDVANAWHDAIKATVRQNTWERYQLNLKKIINYYDSRKTKMIDLDRANVRAFHSYLCCEGKKNQKTGKYEPMAATSIRDVINVMSQICEYAIDTGIINNNPCKGIRTTSKDEKNEKYMDYATAAKFIRFCEENAEESTTDIIKAAINFGLRKSEIIGLRMGDLDLDNQHLTIRNTVTALTSIHIEEDVKTVTSNRIIPLSEAEMQFFLNIISKKEQKKEWYGNTYIRSDYIFTLDNGQLITPAGVYKRAKRLLINFGEPELTFHSLRHTYASILYANGVDLKTAQQLLGHANPETTLKIYTHIGRNRLQSQNVGLLGGNP